MLELWQRSLATVLLLTFLSPLVSVEAAASDESLERLSSALREERWVEAGQLADEVIRQATVEGNATRRAIGRYLQVAAQVGQQGVPAPGQSRLPQVAEEFVVAKDRVGAWFAWTTEAGHRLSSGDLDGARLAYEEAIEVLTPLRGGSWFPTGTLKILMPTAGLGAMAFDIDVIGDLPVGLRTAFIEAMRAQTMLLIVELELNRGDVAAAEAMLRRVDEVEGLGRIVVSAHRSHLVGLVRLHERDVEGALVALGEALRASRLSNDLSREIDVLQTIADVRAAQGEVELALAVHQEMIDPLGRLGDSARLAGALLGLGELEHRAGKLDASLNTLTEALAAIEDAEAGELRSKVLHALASIHLRRGEAETALSYLLSARDASADPVVIAFQEYNLGIIYRMLEHRELAEPHLERAIELAQAAGDRVLLARARAALETLRYRFEDPQRLYELLLDNLAVARELDSALLELETQVELASLDVIYGEVATAVERLKRALEIAQKARAVPHQAWVHMVFGPVLLLSGSPEEAAGHLDEALAIFDRLGDHWGLASANVALGAPWMPGGAEETGGSLLRSQVLHERLRSDVGDMGLSRHFSSGLPVIAAELLIQIQLGQGDHEAAFEAAERARARTLLQRLVSGPANSRKVRDEYRQLLLSDRSGKSADEEGGVATSVEAVQRELLADGTVLVAYFVSTAATFAWVVDGDEVRSVRIGLGPATLERKVTALRTAIDARKPMQHKESLAAELHAQLISPLGLPETADRLIVIPHGPLYGLPFAALWDAEAGEFLGSRRSLTSAPSASALLRLSAGERPEASDVLVLADPTGDLPAAAEAARVVAGLHGVDPVIGAEARESLLWRRARSSRILHLAVHGRFDGRTATSSHLLLAGDADEDGRVEVSEVFASDLSATSLVVLSACESGRGEADAGGESIGLAHAFLAAGSRAVLSTLWPVEDASAAALTIAFHRQLLAGGDPASALHRAQAELRADPRWAHPFHWAAFVLVGSGTSPHRRETLAVVTRIRGEVTAGGDGRPLAPHALLATGDRLRVAAGAVVSMVCRGDRWLRLDADATLSEAACTNGTPLAPGAFAAALPRSGRLASGTAVLDLPAAGREASDDYGTLPVVLSPRRTAVVEPRPVLRWTEVPGADGYAVELRTWDGTLHGRIDRATPPCRPGLAALSDIAVCAQQWPQNLPTLVPGHAYELRVAARLAGEERSSDEENEVRRLDGRRAGELSSAVARLNTGAPDDVTRWLVAAGYYRDERVLNTAIDLYRQVVEVQPSAELHNTLGELYARIWLYRFAGEEYRSALRLGGGGEARAAAWFGLGHVHYLFGRFIEAEEAFDIAADAYRQLGLGKEAREARLGVERARGRRGGAGGER